jgi:GDP-L-fucose synthase
VPESLFDLTSKRVWVAGHRGMVGSAVVRRLQSENVAEVLTVDRSEADLCRQADVEAWMTKARPDVVVLAAAKVGGILANDSYPADFLYQNLMIEANIIHTAAQIGVQKLLFLGSSCIYPKLAPQPISEDALLTGPLEPTNEWYAIAKIAGIKLCQAYRKQYGHDFISAMPTNLYGPGDNYDLQSSHVIPALIRKAHEAKTSGSTAMVVWGSGAPRREFMHVDDLADALIFLLKHYSEENHINIGVGSDVTIAELAKIICDAVGFKGELVYDAKKPDGTLRKLMDGSRLGVLGWQTRTTLEAGLSKVYRDHELFTDNNITIKGQA